MWILCINNNPSPKLEWHLNWAFSPGLAKILMDLQDSEGGVSIDSSSETIGKQ